MDEALGQFNSALHAARKSFHVLACTVEETYPLEHVAGAGLEGIASAGRKDGPGV